MKKDKQKAHRANERGKLSLDKTTATSSSQFRQQPEQSRQIVSALGALTLLLIVFVAGCSSSASNTNSSSGGGSSTGDTQYVAAYKTAAWGQTVTVNYPSTCEITIAATGKPDYTPNPYYLAPANANQTVVAHTAVTNAALALISYSSIAPSLQGSTVTLQRLPRESLVHYRNEPRRHRLSHLRHRDV